MGIFESIGINLPLLLAFVINFLLLFGLLSIVLYKPVLRMLDERQSKIKESIEQAEQIKEQAASSEERIKAQLETARKDGQAIIAQAAQVGEKLKEEAKEQAQKEAETLVAKAQAEIQQEQDRAIEELRREFSNIAILAAEKVINEALDKEKHLKLINEVLESDSTFKQQ